VQVDDHVTDEVLSAFADGDLETRAAEGVSRHLEHCTACAAELDAMMSMRARLREMDTRDAPAALWRKIEDRATREGLIAPAKPSHAGLLQWMFEWPRWLVASAAVAAGALVFAAGWWFAARGPSNAPHPSIAAVAPDASMGGARERAVANVARAEAVYRAAIDRLQQAVGVARPAWNPKVGAAVERSLAEIDRAIERCRGALRTHPDDPRAQEAMWAAYQQKVDLLEELSEEAL
jgi:anti-sigma factor RsiW